MPAFTTGTTPEQDIYDTRIRGERVDPYVIADIYQLESGMAQALKKLLRCGHKHKTMKQDLQEVITSVERWHEIRAQRRKMGIPHDYKFVPGYQWKIDGIAIDESRIARSYGIAAELFYVLLCILQSPSVIIDSAEDALKNSIVEQVNRYMEMDGEDEACTEEAVEQSIAPPIFATIHREEYPQYFAGWNDQGGERWCSSITHGSQPVPLENLVHELSKVAVREPDIWAVVRLPQKSDSPND